MVFGELIDSPNLLNYHQKVKIYLNFLVFTTNFQKIILKILGKNKQLNLLNQILIYYLSKSKLILENY